MRHLAPAIRDYVETNNDGILGQLDAIEARLAVLEHAQAEVKAARLVELEQRMASLERLRVTPYREASER